MSGRWQRVCPADEVASGQPVARAVTGPGGDELRVCVVRRDDGDVMAMLDRCPHRDVALSGGLVSDGVLTCPGHFWRFDLGTGERSDLPEVRVTLFPTRITDGWVEALLPLPAPRPSMREWLLAQARSQY